MSHGEDDKGQKGSRKGLDEECMCTIVNTLGQATLKVANTLMSEKSRAATALNTWISGSTQHTSSSYQTPRHSESNWNALG